MIRVSIIIPVSDVEAYIRDCLESVYRQGLDDGDFEVIIVNDGSRDRTMEVVAEVAGRHANLMVIEQEKAGPSVARNAGMERAGGRYVLFVDSDDLLMDHGLRWLVERAEATGADMVVADYVRMKDEELSGCPSELVDEQVVQKSGRDYYVEDYRPAEGSFIWRILYKRSFLEAHGLRLIPGVYYEDITFLQQCYLTAERVVGTHLLYYIYRIRERSCTYSFTMKNAMDYNTAIEQTWGLMRTEGLTERVRRQIEANAYVLFSYAVDCIITVFRRPEDRRAIVSDLRRKVPDLRFGGGVRRRVVSWVWRTMPYAYIRCRQFSKRFV